MEWEEDETVFVGVDKIDLESDDTSRAVVGSVVYGPSITGGEAFFVPSHADPAECDGELHPCSVLLGLLCIAPSVPLRVIVLWMLSLTFTCLGPRASRF